MEIPNSINHANKLIERCETVGYWFAEAVRKHGEMLGYVSSLRVMAAEIAFYRQWIAGRKGR